MSHQTPKVLQPDFPFSPRNSPVFYGWIIVGASVLGVSSSIPGQTAGVGPFTEQLLTHLDLSRIGLSGAYMVGTIGGGLLLPKIGGYFDRFGARPLGVISQVAFGLALFYMASCDRLYDALNPSDNPKPWLAFVLIAFGFFLIRFIGQGVITLIARALIGKWFNRKRGLASAVSGSFASVCFASSPLLLYELVEIVGWRGAWVACGLYMLFFMTTASWLLYRDNPEECGLQMDGEDLPDTPEGPGDPEFTIHHEFTDREAIRTFSFWVFTLTFCLNGIYATAFSFHAVDVARESGLSADNFFKLFLVMTLVNIPTGFLIGWLTSKTRLKHSLSIMTITMAISAAGLISLPSTLGIAAFVIGGGVSWACFGTLMAVAYPRFFGRRHLGKISGWAMLALVMASAVAPIIWSLSQEITGAYAPATWAFIVSCVILLIASFKADNPQRKLSPKEVGS
ncbi:MFS transporter [Rubellicoccus peritrichatus]|uniref:MFS transporter n=1 Tax=Rubellicoccus peritrichatus TaxID=3080537 RepID=A0AAQ3LJC2_9BACT|nr:MFS transporter [Puniceicoccus sp. CR14]WOO43249.1 MFS transporter [Puniceicoccus sp. CR14]